MTEKKFDENYWKDKLSSEQFYITRKGGTERPFSGKYLDNKENGIYVCVCCETELFDSDNKYNSNSGWPSFTEPLSDHLIKSLEEAISFRLLRDPKNRSYLRGKEYLTIQGTTP